MSAEPNQASMSTKLMDDEDEIHEPPMKRFKSTKVEIPKPMAIVLDIEGTIISKSHFTDILLPYTRQNFRKFLYDNSDVEYVSKRIEMMKDEYFNENPQAEELFNQLFTESAYNQYLQQIKQRATSNMIHNKQSTESAVVISKHNTLPFIDNDMDKENDMELMEMNHNDNILKPDDKNDSIEIIDIKDKQKENEMESEDKTSEQNEESVIILNDKKSVSNTENMEVIDVGMDDNEKDDKVEIIEIMDGNDDKMVIKGDGDDINDEDEDIDMMQQNENENEKEIEKKEDDIKEKKEDDKEGINDENEKNEIQEIADHQNGDKEIKDVKKDNDIIMDKVEENENMIDIKDEGLKKEDDIKNEQEVHDNDTNDDKQKEDVKENGISTVNMNGGNVCNTDIIEIEDESQGNNDDNTNIKQCENKHDEVLKDDDVIEIDDDKDDKIKKKENVGLNGDDNNNGNEKGDTSNVDIIEIDDDTKKDVIDRDDIDGDKVKERMSGRKRKLVDIIDIDDDDDEDTEDEEDEDDDLIMLNNTDKKRDNNMNRNGVIIDIDGDEENEENEEEVLSELSIMSKSEFYREKEINLLMQIINEWLDCNLKMRSMQYLQGLIIENGFKSGALKSNLYLDAFECIKKWNELDHINIYIYSHGTCAAQQLLCKYTKYGDLDGYISRYFDLYNTGNKKYSKSYLKLLKEIQSDQWENSNEYTEDEQIESILFITDNNDEVKAAKKAGLTVIQSVRQEIDINNNNNNQQISDFNQIQWIKDNKHVFSLNNHINHNNHYDHNNHNSYS